MLLHTQLTVPSEDMEHQECSTVRAGGIENGANTDLSYTVAILFLGYYSRVMKVLPYKTCMWMYLAALFLTSKNWKQPKGPSMCQ